MLSGCQTFARAAKMLDQGHGGCDCQGGWPLLCGGDFRHHGGGDRVCGVCSRLHSGGLLPTLSWQRKEKLSGCLLGSAIWCLTQSATATSSLAIIAPYPVATRTVTS